MSLSSREWGEKESQRFVLTVIAGRDDEKGWGLVPGKWEKKGTKGNGTANPTPEKCTLSSPYFR